jgi:hypothetical protein
VNNIRNILIASCYAITLNCDATGIKVTAEINDENATRNPIRSFNATSLTIGGLQSKLANLKAHQVVAIWCEGTEMGTAGASAFDVLHGNIIDSDVSKLGVTKAMSLVQLCKLQQEAFARRRQ